MFIEKVFEYSIIRTIDNLSGKQYIELGFSVYNDPDIIMVSLDNSKCSELRDFAIFDSNNMFRGWNAGRRLSVYIAFSTASPGFIPGPLPNGLWKLVIRIPRGYDKSCEVTVRVYGIKSNIGRLTFNNLEGDMISVLRSLRTLADLNPYKYVIEILNTFNPYNISFCKSIPKSSNKLQKGRWICGDLHVHTLHSDGRNTVCEVVLIAEALGIDFVAFTDHNTISQNHELQHIDQKDVLLIPGIEITNPYGHVNVIGVHHFIDFRRSSEDEYIKLFKEVHEYGGLVTVNHPIGRESELCTGCDFEFRSLRGFDCIEVWNGPWSMFNELSLEWWHSILCEGLRVTAVGGSDYHGGSFDRLGIPTTWIYVEDLSLSSVMRSLKNSRVIITSSPFSKPIDFYVVDKYGERYFIGDELQLKNRSEYTIEVANLENYKGCTLKIITEDELIDSIKIVDGLNLYRKHIDGKALENKKFIRLEIGLYSDDYSILPRRGDELKVIVNPIYINKSTE